MKALHLFSLTFLLMACGGDTKDAESTSDAGVVDADGDGATAAVDCDDADASVHPGAEEICNAIDDNCDGVIDEPAADGSTFYRDHDGDGYGDNTVSMQACAAPDGFTSDDGDCDDAEAAVYPGAPEDDCTDPVDYNCDGSTGYADLDGDGTPACNDCDDTDPDVNPYAAEICNDGVDDNCDGVADEEGSVGEQMWFADADGDLHGDPAVQLVSCSQPEGFVDNSDDCDDSASEANPSGVEVCDGLDNDCDGTVDGPDPIGGMTVYVDADGDGVGTTAVSRIVCTPEDDFVSVSGDCDDTDPSAFPGAEEVCDGVDNDCSGEADEGLLMTVYPDPDGDGYGMALLPMEACVVESGMSATAGDCDETDAAVHPGADEVCDGVDNDCSGEADEGLGITYYLDTDGDGFGVADMTIEACSFPVGYALTPGDCDNSDSSINPSAPETCDEVDNDCDGDIDDDDGSLVLDEDSVWFADADDDGFGDTDDSVLACVPLDGYIADDSDCDDDDPAAFPGAEEVWYDGVDQDCSGGSDFDADGDGRDAVASGGDDTDDEDPDCWDSCLVGVSPDAPADSCKAIAEDNPSAPNDWYWVDIDGSVTSVYCDIEAGGWTQCFEVENTFADDFGTSNDWMDDCVDLTMGSWSGNEVRVTLIDPSGETIYDEFGDRPTTWTYEHLTSTTYSGGQYHSEAHSGRWVNLSNGDKLLIPGRSSDNSGCGGSFGSGYAVLVYPPSPSYHSNVKMIVASYTLRYGSPRSFSGWSPSHEISYQEGGMDTCSSTIASAGTFAFWVR